MADYPHEGRVMPVDSALDDDANPLAALSPLSLDEINDYLYDEGRPAEERLERLRSYRDGLAGLDASDVMDDVSGLRSELDAAIATLEESERAAPEDLAQALDPADHIEAQSPDDTDAIARITGDGRED